MALTMPSHSIHHSPNARFTADAARSVDVRGQLKGKWSDPGVPHRGWDCVTVEELDELATCEMCESVKIRYSHRMRHPDYDTELIVGCVCAEHMEGDDLGPRARESRLRKTSASRRKWLSRKWRVSPPGSSHLRTRDGFRVLVWHHGPHWSGEVRDLRFEREIAFQFHEPEGSAKIAAFDILQTLKREPWNKIACARKSSDDPAECLVA
jgi:hypothetical protein